MSKRYVLSVLGILAVNGFFVLFSYLGGMLRVLPIILVGIVIYIALVFSVESRTGCLTVGLQKVSDFMLESVNGALTAFQWVVTLCIRHRKNVLLLIGGIITLKGFGEVLYISTMVERVMWQLPLVLCMIGGIVKGIHFWRGKKRHSCRIHAVKEWRGFGIKGIISLGLVFALSISLGYSLTGGVLAVWQLCGLGLGLSIWIKMLSRFLSGMRFSRREIYRELRVLSGEKPYLKAGCLISIGGIVTGGLLIWGCTLTPGTPFYYATGSLYHFIKALPAWETTELLQAVAKAVRLFEAAALPVLMSPWVFFFMIPVGGLFRRYAARIGRWYQKHSRVWELTIIRDVMVGGALVASLIGGFILVAGKWLGVNPFSGGPVLLATLPFTILYYGKGFTSALQPRDFESSQKRIVSSLLLGVGVIVVFGMMFSPVVEVDTVSPKFQDTSYEGLVANAVLALYDADTGGFCMTEVSERATLCSTYMGVRILAETTQLERLNAQQRDTTIQFIKKQQGPRGGFGTLEDSFYAVESLRYLDALDPDLIEGVATFLKNRVASGLDFQAYSNDLEIAYQAIQLSKALEKPLSHILDPAQFPLGARNLVSDKDPKTTLHMLEVQTDGGWTDSITFQVFQEITIPLYTLADSNLPTLRSRWNLPLTRLWWSISFMKGGHSKGGRERSMGGLGAAPYSL